MNKYSRKRVKHLLIALKLVLAGFFGLQACAKYEQVTDRLDFLKFEYFTCDVVSVTDGESFTCQTPDMDMHKIRLIGTHVPAESEDEAKKYCKSILRRGTLVKVEPDDKSGEETGGIPAYVFIPGGKMLNVLLIENGYASLVKNEVSDKYMNQFAEAAGKAAEEDNETREKKPWLR